MRLVYRNENPLAVHSAKNILDMNGIESFLKNEHGSTMGVEFGISNIIELWVKSANEQEKATSLIETEMEKQSNKPSWVCNECKEENEGSFEICWKCQSNKS